MGIINELRKYGLSEKEASVYVALLKLGPSAAKHISKECHLIRTTLYDVLKSLREKGIVAATLKNKIHYFEAADPEKLIEILDEKKDVINRVMTELRTLRREVDPYPRGEIFEGVDGVKTVFTEILKDKKPLYAFSNNSAMIKLVPFFGPHFIEARVKKKIPIKIISEPSEFTDKELIAKDKKEFRETRVLPELTNVNINEYITEDLVAILGSRADEPIGILIRQKDFARLQIELFERVWKVAKK
jgi:sugar-specific transcriptional regulator TrmB